MFLSDDIKIFYKTLDILSQYCYINIGQSGLESGGFINNIKNHYFGADKIDE